MKTMRWIAAGAVVSLAACAGTRIGNPDDYKPVTMNRVYPYPSDEELGKQKTEVILATRYARELPEEVVGEAMTAVQRALERILGAAGAGVIDRSIHDLKEIRDELEAAEHGKGTADGDAFTSADWAVISRMTRFRHWSEYAPPSSIFKSDEELASEPGTCTHYGEVEIDIKAFRIPTDDVARATFRIRNSDDFSESEHDDSCPLSDTRTQVFLEQILEEVLPCLDVAVKNRFSPRGYIEDHRINVAGQHIFLTSLGERNGAVPGLDLVIFRAQHMTTAEGRQTRDERAIGNAVVTDEIGDDHSWITVDMGNPEIVLAGDLVRAVYSDTFAAQMGIGKCDDALSVTGEP